MEMHASQMSLDTRLLAGKEVWKKRLRFALKHPLGKGGPECYKVYSYAWKAYTPL